VSHVKSICWGLDHSLMVDSMNRLYSTGFNRYGRLGMGDEKDKIKYTLIPAMRKEKIIEVQAGMFHSLAVTKEG
jgi:alpha-tubulin suppressor-like RCC1 family protein